MLYEVITKINRPEHISMVSHGHCRHIVFFNFFKKVIEPNGPIEKRVLGVKMQVNKTHARCSKILRQIGAH